MSFPILLNLNNQVVTHQFRYRFSQPIDFSQYEIAPDQYPFTTPGEQSLLSVKTTALRSYGQQLRRQRHKQLRSPMAPIRQATSITTFNIGLSKTISI
ncbi:hypothetical protein Plhal710r2_c039g0136891 [Plasmopara halstedii]